MLQRTLVKELKAYLKLMPVTLLAGARQTGKTTLIESLARDFQIPIYTFDDEFTLSNAKYDPSGWLASLPKPLVIDEVQRAPEIFLAIKQDVDQNRQPGRYLLTGSANPLLLPTLGDSLAGRMGILNLYPFSQGELHQVQEQFIPWVFAETFSSHSIKAPPLDNLYHILYRGGFPPVQTLTDDQDITRWIRAYLQTMMQRDVRDLANIEKLREFPRLFQLLATRSAQLLNVSDLSRSLGMVQTTLHRYIRLLEALFFIHILPSWFSNLGKRIIKSPKIHLCDTAILCTLIGVDPTGLSEQPLLFGQLLETFVFSEILKQKQWAPFPVELFHFRDGDYEVDLVLEKADSSLIGIEVKGTRQLTAKDWKGLSHLKHCAKHFRRGIILYLGSQIERVDEDLWAIPLQMLWQQS